MALGDFKDSERLRANRIMSKPVRILLQTTIQAVEDDWNIERFSLLRDYLGSLTDDEGRSLYDVTARNREVNASGNDAVLSRLDETDFAELWLFAVDIGDGLTMADCEGITRFRQSGGGILTTRDHQDTKSISWPNYHSGNNGDYQRLTPVEPIHELLQNPSSRSGVIEYFPAHPHEGGIGVPKGEQHARVIATGRSQVSGRPFNLIVAFESVMDGHGNKLGRAVAESSFHHLVDYNWDISKGSPSFVAELPGDQIKREPEKLNDVKTYVRNLAGWLSRRTG